MGRAPWPDFSRMKDRSDYYEEQRILNEQKYGSLFDAYELEYYGDGEECDSYDWRDY